MSTSSLQPRAKYNILHPPTDEEVKYLLHQIIRARVKDPSSVEQMVNLAQDLADNFRARCEMVEVEIDRFKQEEEAKAEGNLGLVQASDAQARKAVPKSAIRRIADSM